MRRVVLTGFGVISPIGNNLAEFERELFSGGNGIGRISRFDPSEYKVELAGEVKGFDPEVYLSQRDLHKMDPFTIYAMAATHQALEQSGLMSRADPHRVGVIVGSGIGGIITFQEQHRRLLEDGARKVSPFFVPMMISDIAAGQISIHYGLKGPNYSVVSACATASNAIGDAFRLIRYGDADAIVCGGCEATITPIAMAGFTNMKALSRNPDPNTACRPFDLERDGFVMSEGAGIVVLETLEHAETHGTEILAELVGYGATADAYHITSPAPGGEGAARAMQAAILDAGIEPQAIGYINAHGTSTPYNDKNETAAVKTVFGDHATKLVLSSTKSMTGHLLGASGGIEGIATSLALNRQLAPPTINYTTPDPECDLNYSPNNPTPFSSDYALSNTFGFGGHNAVLLLKRFTD